MIDMYKTRDGKVYQISKMEDDHLLNAHRYFAVKRLEIAEKPNITGKDLLKLSLLINSLWQEIDRRDLLKY